MTAPRFVLDVDEYGVLLHTCSDHVFWSKYNPHGFATAVIFRDEAEVHLWLRNRFPTVAADEFPKWRLIPVADEPGGFASIGAVVKADPSLMWDVDTQGRC